MGRVVSGKSAHLIPESGKLESATKYFVRVKSDDGVDETPWSETAYFITGLTEGEVWSAPFVSAETEEADREVSKGTYVRGTFTVEKTGKRSICNDNRIRTLQFLPEWSKKSERMR